MTYTPTWAWNPEVIRRRLTKLTHIANTSDVPYWRYNAKTAIEFWEKRLIEAEKRLAEANQPPKVETGE